MNTVKKIRLLALSLVMLNILMLPTSHGQQLNFASIVQLSEQQVAGIVLPQIYQKLGKTAIITPLPASRAQQEANSGVKDGEILRIFNYGLETPNVIRVPTPYYNLTTAAFSQLSSEINISKLADLAQYRIGIVRGVQHTKVATRGMPKVYKSNTSEQLFRQLAQGHIDIALTNYRDGIYTMKKLPPQTFKVLHKELAYEPLYHYINKQHANIVTEVDQIIKQLTANGELAKMLKQAEQQVY